ncbi:MAG: hypothetical protein WC211_11260 [Dehalococcoidia bacterium]
MLHASRTRPVLAIALAVVAAGLLLLGSPNRAQAQVTAMLPDMLKNLTYPSEYTVSGFAPLRDGRYDQRAALNDPLKPALVTFVASSTGPEYSAVILATNTGGSGVFSTIHLVRAQNGVALAGPGLFTGDRERDINLLMDDEGTFIVTLTTQGPGEPLCCGTKREVREYRPDGNRLRLIAVDGKPPVVTPPRTGNLGTGDTATSTLLLASVAALALPLAARRLVGAVEAA